MRDARRIARSAIFLAAFLIVPGSSPVEADDRDFLRTTTGSPYVMVLFDTSGSMNWAPRCTQAQFDAGICQYLCPAGDCMVPRNADDPASKFRQAKEAMYEVLKTIPQGDVFFGFSTYNQDQLGILSKNWIYRVAPTSPIFTLENGTTFPAVGSDEVFGGLIACDDGGTDGGRGCFANNPADLNDPWELTRVRRLPKLGPTNTNTVSYYIRAPAVGGVSQRVYWIFVTPLGGEVVGNPTLRARIELRRCTPTSNSPTNGCNGGGEYTSLGTRDVVYNRVSEFIQWENGVDRTAPQDGFFNELHSSAGNTCGGWDPVTDSLSDPYPNSTGYRLKHPTVAETDLSILPATLRPRLDRGDVIPLDWRTNNQQALLERFAPSLVSAPLTDPNTNEGFSTSVYMNDRAQGADAFLRLKSEAQRPLVANGSTPLGFSLEAFRVWYAGCSQGNCPSTAGWKALAAVNDPDWACRQKFLIVVTDGDDTCPGRDPCSFTASLRAQEGVLTYVVAFGVENVAGNRLTCMAANGGTGAPIYPQNKQELVDALTAIFGSIVETARTFASAAVPAVQASVTDKVYLTNFTPLNNTPIWPGHVDAYLKPLPTTPEGLPDRARACNGATRECFAWDAGTAMLDQAPDPNQVSVGDRDLGYSATERRVFYGKLTANIVPAPRLLFEPPTTPADKYDLWSGMGISFTPGVPASEAAAAAAATTVIDKTVVEKSYPNPSGTGTIPYILGDLFHSTPQIVGNPDSFEYYAANVNGYRSFFKKHQCRRKVVLVGSNDGQLHAFHAGDFAGDCSPINGPDPEPDPPAEPTTNIFDVGTGQELFSFIPRGALPTLKKMFDTGRQEWSVDGTVTPADVFIDPLHNGTPTLADREWRTVVVGGLREGGRWYYALDVTQPDLINPALNAPVSPTFVPSCSGPGLPGGCGPTPYPSVLWELSDQWDEDVAVPGFGFPDMGDTWSVPNVGRIRVCVGNRCDPAVLPNDVVEKSVAIMGGGMDPGRLNRTGNWLYMVDVETGKMIYKRRLEGSAPSEPAAVDTNSDGYIDTVYIGTTTGFLYKASIGSIAVLENALITDRLTGQVHAVQRVLDLAWEPFKIFDTVNPVTLARLPIYYPPAVVFVGKKLQFALAFGTGDRENLWLPTTEPGRFYVVLDENFTSDQVVLGQLPRTQSQFRMVDPSLLFSPTVGLNKDYLVTPNPNPGETYENGWFFDLEPSERFLNKAFALSGVVVFATYNPRTDHPGPGLCARSGDSRIFGVSVANADPLLVHKDDLSDTRFVQIDDQMPTAPTAEQNLTRNEGTGQNQVQPNLERIAQMISALMPENCKFGALRVDIRSLLSDTRVETIASVPVCHVEKNWKDF